MAETVTTRVYRPVDILLRAQGPAGNPFDVELWVTFQGPGGEQLRMPGYYAGGERWVVRFSPMVEGRWRYVTHSPQPKLDGRTGIVEAAANTNDRVHGPLRVDPEHPHHFLHHDGTRPFLMGYECDWLWALDQTAEDIPRVRKLVDLIAEHNFNVVATQAYAHHCSWSEHVKPPARVAPPELIAWQGTNDKPDYAALNIPYWNHYDRVMDYLFEKGITVFLMIRVYNKFVGWPENGSPDDDRYWRYVLARYQAYPNVVWVLSKEAHAEKDRPGYWNDRIRFIRAYDAYQHLITTHDDDAFAHVYDLDLRFDQQHEDWNGHIIAERRRRAWPVINAEFGYEGGPIPTYPVQQPIEEFLRRAWLITAGGGYLVYYYSDTAWDVITFDEPAGYDHFARIPELMRTLPFHEMEPHNELVDVGYCLAKPGGCYLVVLDEARKVTLNVRRAGRELAACWFNPLTGDWAEAAKAGSGQHTFTVPKGFGNLAVLVVGRRHE